LIFFFFFFLNLFSFGSLRGGGGGDGRSSPAKGDVPSPGRTPSANVTDFLPSFSADIGFSLLE
jgi:hypothetical protein